MGPLGYPETLVRNYKY